MVVGVKGVDDRAVLWRARPQVEMPWATVCGSMVESSGGRIKNIGRVRYDSTKSYPPRHWLRQVQCQVWRVQLWDSQIPISNHQSCLSWRLKKKKKKKKKNYSRLTQPLPLSKSTKMRDQGMRVPLPHYNWRTARASMLVDCDSLSPMSGLNKIPSPAPMTLDCDWNLGESFGFGDLLVVVGIGRTLFGKLVILYFIMQHQI